MRFWLQLSTGCAFLSMISSGSADDLSALKAEAAAHTFLTICGEKNFTAALAEETAASQSWPPLSKDIVTVNRPDFPVTMSYGWMLVPKDLYPSLIFLFAYEGEDPRLGDVNVCSIFFREPNSRDVMSFLGELTPLENAQKSVEGAGVSEVFTMPELGDLAGFALYGESDQESIHLYALHKK